jgi:hypothetical protein
MRLNDRSGRKREYESQAKRSPALSRMHIRRVGNKKQKFGKRYYADPIHPSYVAYPTPTTSPQVRRQLLTRRLRGSEAGWMALNIRRKP